MWYVHLGVVLGPLLLPKYSKVSVLVLALAAPDLILILAPLVQIPPGSDTGC